MVRDWLELSLIIAVYSIRFFERMHDKKQHDMIAKILQRLTDEEEAKG